MPLIKSLFCFQGADNQYRYIIILLSSIFLFVLSKLLFAAYTPILMIITAILTTVVTLAIKRRLNDAALKGNIFYAPIIVLIICCFIIINFENKLLLTLLIIPIILFAILVKYAPSTERVYVIGYHGPIHFDTQQAVRQQYRQRIEPTVTHDSTAVLSNPSTSTVNETTSLQHNTHVSISDLWLQYKSNRSILLALIAAGMTLLIILSAFISSEDAVVTLEEKKADITSATNIEQHSQEVYFNDNFSLALSPAGNLVISWSTNNFHPQLIWSLETAQGDSDCKAITFNNGNSIRTFKVANNDEGSYSAYFSPLDSSVLVQNLAFRGNFTLCNKKFSLKGSQNILGRNKFYGNLLEY